MEIYYSLNGTWAYAVSDDRLSWAATKPSRVKTWISTGVDLASAPWSGGWNKVANPIEVVQITPENKGSWGNLGEWRLYSRGYPCLKSHSIIYEPKPLIEIGI